MLNKAASKRSKTPPCPGKMFPLSFISKLRLNKDSSKSPKMAHGPMITAEITQNKVNPWLIYVPIMNPKSRVNIIQPMVPSQVFFEEKR